MKTDIVKQDREYYTAKIKASLITIAPSFYLSIKGKGDPSSEIFSDKVSALFALAYALKFYYKSLNKDFTVSKLEGLWWYDESKYKSLSANEAPKKVPREEWLYRLLIRIPDYVLKQSIVDIKTETYQKKKLHEILNVEAFELTEGKSVQILHKGSYSKEPETLALMHDFMIANNLTRNGFHHEIYLSDVRKTAVEKLRTILRQPVK